MTGDRHNHVAVTCHICNGKGVSKVFDNSKPIVMHVPDNLGQVKGQVWEFTQAEFPTMAHVAAHIGVFKSVNEARKNGWNKPVTVGKHFFKKKTIMVTIHET